MHFSDEKSITYNNTCHALNIYDNQQFAKTTNLIAFLQDKKHKIITSKYSYLINKSHK